MGKFPRGSRHSFASSKRVKKDVTAIMVPDKPIDEANFYKICEHFGLAQLVPYVLAPDTTSPDP
eukprot:4568099-Pyramimonas_sp.AAC.1